MTEPPTVARTAPYVVEQADTELVAFTTWTEAALHAWTTLRAQVARRPGTQPKLTITDRLAGLRRQVGEPFSTSAENRTTRPVFRAGRPVRGNSRTVSTNESE